MVWFPFIVLLHHLTLLNVNAQEGAGVTASGGINPSYACSSQSCSLPSCRCASIETPGNLPPNSIPQFMTLTFDDNVDSVIWPYIRNITDGHKANPNGCPLSATFFVSTQWTNFWQIQQLYGQGHEIATHTMSHVANGSGGEITGAQQALSSFGGIPGSKVNGFRTPFLAYTPAIYQTLTTSKKFLYDSSMPVDYLAAPIWPYTLDHGAATTCHTGSCPGNFAGLWEIPMYILKNPDGTLNAAMEPNGAPGSRSSIPAKESLLKVLKYNFEQRYNGSRVPMGLYLHAAANINAESRTEAYKEFIDWTLTFKDVYWINNQQLLNWIKNPTNSQDSLNAPSLDCLMPATAPGNSEICDGVDNTGNGQIDPGLTTSCYYPGVEISFESCFGCPPSAPSVNNPVPVSMNSRPHFVSDQGCPNSDSWDPIKGTCVTLERAKKAPIQSDPVVGPGTNNPKSGYVTNRPNSGSRLKTALIVGVILAIIL